MNDPDTHGIIMIGEIGGNLEAEAGNWIKDNSIVIDAGYHPEICGDIELENVSDRSMAYTPVPGGVGPMTIACLMYNTVKASFLRNNHEFKEIIFDE